jgi:hypothetical protein
MCNIYDRRAQMLSIPKEEHKFMILITGCWWYYLVVRGREGREEMRELQIEYLQRSQSSPNTMRLISTFINIAIERNKYLN